MPTSWASNRPLHPSHETLWPRGLRAPRSAPQASQHGRRRCAGNRAAIRGQNLASYSAGHPAKRTVIFRMLPTGITARKQGGVSKPRTQARRLRTSTPPISLFSDHVEKPELAPGASFGELLRSSIECILDATNSFCRSLLSNATVAYVASFQVAWELLG